MDKDRKEIILDRGGLFRPSQIHRVTKKEYKEIKKYVEDNSLKVNTKQIITIIIPLIYFICFITLLMLINIAFEFGRYLVK